MLRILDNSRQFLLQSGTCVVVCGTIAQGTPRREVTVGGTKNFILHVGFNLNHRMAGWQNFANLADEVIVGGPVAEGRKPPLAKATDDGHYVGRVRM